MSDFIGHNQQSQEINIPSNMVFVLELRNAKTLTNTDRLGYIHFQTHPNEYVKVFVQIVMCIFEDVEMKQCAIDTVCQSALTTMQGDAGVTSVGRARRARIQSVPCKV